MVDLFWNLTCSDLWDAKRPWAGSEALDGRKAESAGMSDARPGHEDVG